MSNITPDVAHAAKLWAIICMIGISLGVIASLWKTARVGTKSVLIGAHCFFIHPWFVALAWWKLFGFPYDVRLWVAFFVHDLGYVGKPNMDGEEGERHPELGAEIMHWLFDREDILNVDDDLTWYNFALLHSRFYAKKNALNVSKLCFADKLSFCLTPYWLYIPMATLTGEIDEYMKLAKAPTKWKAITRTEHDFYQNRDATLHLVVDDEGRSETVAANIRLDFDTFEEAEVHAATLNGRENAAQGKYAHANIATTSKRAWHANVADYMRKWTYEHVDGREDTWTPSVHDDEKKKLLNPLAWVNCAGCLWHGHREELIDLPDPIDLPIAGNICPNCKRMQL